MLWEKHALDGWDRPDRRDISGFVSHVAPNKRLGPKWGRAICTCSQEWSSGVPVGGKEKKVYVGLSKKTICNWTNWNFLSSDRCFPDTKKALKSKRKLEKIN